MGPLQTLSPLCMLSTLYLQCMLCLLSMSQFCLPLHLLNPHCLPQFIQMIPQKAHDANTDCESSSHNCEQHDSCLLQDANESPPVAQNAKQSGPVADNDSATHAMQSITNDSAETCQQGCILPFFKEEFKFETVGDGTTVHSLSVHSAHASVNACCAPQGAQLQVSL